MTFDHRRRGRSNRDRRDQAFARSVIAEAERRRRETAAKLLHDFAELGRSPQEWEAYNNGLCCMSRHANAIPPWTCDCPCHNKPDALPEQDWYHTVCASEGYPPDVPEPDRCLMCNDRLSGNCEARDEHYPYCSARCSIEAEVS